MSAKSERDNLRRKTIKRGQVKRCDTFREAVEALRAPYTPEAVRFRVSDAWALKEGDQPTHATVVPYVSASAVIDRLNLVCPGAWTMTPRWDRGDLWCDLVIGGVLFTDLGEQYKGKALWSDARQRAAWAAGVGISLRATPVLEFTCESADADGSPLLKPWRIDGEPWLHLTRAGERTARDAYRRWLLAHGGGIDSFGKPLDQGNLTMRGEVDGEGPPMPVLRPGEKRDAPARGRGRQAPQPSVPSATAPAPAPTADPEELAAAELAKVLAVADGLGTLRDVLDKTMIAQGVEKASERLRVIVDAGDKRGLDAALLRFARVEQMDDAPIEQEGDTT